MTKFLCVDFDATLSDPQMSQFIKDTVETKKREGIEDLKIGIVTSRSIYDDFKTYGQFHHEIEDVLTEYNIELDFICTRFCLHVINHNDYREHGIKYAIEKAALFPVFGETPSNYLAYRSAHQTHIQTLRTEPDHDKTQELKALVEEQIQFELDLREEFINDKMIGDNTPKINQIETTITTMMKRPLEELSDVEVLLLDDAAKHIRAVDNYPNENWAGCSYWANITPIELAVNQFIQPLFHKEARHRSDLVAETTELLTTSVGGQGFFSRDESVLDRNSKQDKSTGLKSCCTLM